MKRNSKIGLYLCAGLLMFSSCAKDDGPSIDDYFLNYEIPDVEPPAGLQLGAYYMNLGGGGMNAEKYARLKQPLDYANSILGANVIPMLSSVNYPEEGSKATDAPYPMNPNNEEFIAIAQQQVDWALQAGLDFFILPNCNTSMGKYPNVLGDTAFVNVVTGRRDVTGKAANDPACGALVDLKGLKYVISVNMNNFNNQPTALKAEEGGRVEEVQDVVSTRPLKYQTRLQRFNDIFKRIADYFSDPNYFKVDGKPMVVIIAADKTHSLDSKKLYADMRAYVKEERGYDMFLVARQGAFTPPGRYQYYFVGNVDALCFAVNSALLPSAPYHIALSVVFKSTGMNRPVVAFVRLYASFHHEGSFHRIGSLILDNVDLVIVHIAVVSGEIDVPFIVYPMDFGCPEMIRVAGIIGYPYLFLSSM